MSKLVLFIVNISHIEKDEILYKHLLKRHLFPIGNDKAFFTEDTTLSLKLEIQNTIIIDDHCKIVEDHNQWSIQSEKLADFILKNNEKMDYICLFSNGDRNLVEVIVKNTSAAEIMAFGDENQENSLVKYGLPPPKAYCFENSDDCDIPRRLQNYYAKNNQKLFNVSSQKFLSDPHVLTKLFEKVLVLKSEDQIDAITAIRIIANNLRQYLEPHIKMIPRNHPEAWAKVYGEEIAFLDGGMSRIGSMPSVEPVGIRAGIYSVIPGLQDLDKREQWILYSETVGDVLNDRTFLYSDDAMPDPKRLQEAARYIVEALAVLRYIKKTNTKNIKYFFMHGPLQSSFQTYDELSPNNIPSLDVEFLERYGISKNDILENVELIPENINRVQWNSPIPVYLYAMKKYKESDIPIIGVVERAHRLQYSISLIEWLNKNGFLDSGSKTAIIKKLQKYNIDDEFLFGCILDEGEYIDVVPVKKNYRNRAHERWQPVVDQFPDVLCSMLKTSSYAFPFRVEIATVGNVNVPDIMNLLYHTALLLPNYAFPVGLDIVDKYAKIPDWLSKGISVQVATSVLLKAMQTGDSRIVQQVRQKMSMSPRDFFYRPGVK